MKQNYSRETFASEISSKASVTVLKASKFLTREFLKTVREESELLCGARVRLTSLKYLSTSEDDGAAFKIKRAAFESMGKCPQYDSQNFRHRASIPRSLFSAFVATKKNKSFPARFFFG